MGGGTEGWRTDGQMRTMSRLEYAWMNEEWGWMDGWADGGRWIDEWVSEWLGG